MLCVVSLHGFAQVRLGIQGGVSVANFWQTEGFSGLVTRLSSSPIAAYHGGIIAEVDLGSHLVLQPALLYFESGSHLQNTTGFVNPPGLDINYSNTTVKLYSLRLPVNLVWKIDIDKKTKILFGLGPYIAQGTSGTEKGYYIAEQLSSNSAVRVPIDNKIHFSNATSYATSGMSYASSFDIGGNILAGVEYKKFQLTIDFNRGLSRMYRSFDANCGTLAWNFSLAYYIFGHNRKPQP